MHGQVDALLRELDGDTTDFLNRLQRRTRG
jgi:hypothetical protein